MEILLLTQTDCAFCDHAKEILTRLAPEYALSVVTVDAGTDQGRKIVESSGLLFAPGLFIDGELLFYGRLSERRLRRAFELRRSFLHG